MTTNCLKVVTEITPETSISNMPRSMNTDQRTMAIRKVPSGDLLTKQAMKKSIIYNKIHIYLSYLST
jgi:hypothetical protein